jgi:hypothetical protein
MRPACKRVAECADNRAFEADEIRGAITPALEQVRRARLDRLAPGSGFFRDTFSGSAFRGCLERMVQNITLHA